jgi:hypothetical protein
MEGLWRFLEFWYGTREPEYGETEERLVRLPLPYPLRQFYAFAGRWPSPVPVHGMDYFYTGAAGHHLHDLDHVHPGPDGLLRFFMEYQGDWVGLTLPDVVDPPVWIEGYWDEPADNALDDEKREMMVPKAKQVSGALSKFLVTHCLMTSAYEPVNSPYDRTSSPPVNDALAEWLRRDQMALERIWDIEPNGCPNYEGTFYLFHRHILVHQSEGSFYKFGARHREGIELMRNMLGERA